LTQEQFDQLSDLHKLLYTKHSGPLPKGTYKPGLLGKASEAVGSALQSIHEPARNLSSNLGAYTGIDPYAVATRGMEFGNEIGHAAFGGGGVESAERAPLPPLPAKRKRAPSAYNREIGRLIREDGHDFRTAAHIASGRGASAI